MCRVSSEADVTIEPQSRAILANLTVPTPSKAPWRRALTSQIGNKRRGLEVATSPLTPQRVSPKDGDHDQDDNPPVHLGNPTKLSPRTFCTVVPIEIPPLRDRREDIEPLACCADF